jgi:hypothetical protein
MTSDNERQGVDEEEHVMWDKNEDYYARKKRGQLGRYATIDRTWDDDQENKRQLYLIKRERAKAWFFLILSDICQYIMCEYTQW